jgi:hypothetical protein
MASFMRFGMPQIAVHMMEPLVRTPPFDIAHFQHWVPGIEERLRNLRPHSVVCGLGPSSYLLPHIDQSLLAGVRIWGVNDFWRIRPCNDLVLMDQPLLELDPHTIRYDWVIKSRPDRFWIYDGFCDPVLHQGKSLLETWKKAYGGELPAPHKVFQLTKWDTRKMPKKDGKVAAPQLQGRPYHHMMMSPVGTLSIAWGDGSRRIGLIGVDLLPMHHRQSQNLELHSWFVSHFGVQAKALGGAIVNLNPHSKLKGLDP